MAFDLTGKAVKHLRLPTVTYSGSVVKLVPAQSGDVNSRFFRVTLYDDRGDIPLRTYSKVTLFATLPDGSKQKCDGELDESYEFATCRLEGSMLSQPGKVACDISLYGNDSNGVGTTLTSQTFYVLVSQSQEDERAPDGSGEIHITTANLPTVTNADDGKILQVVDGKWAAVNVSIDLAEEYDGGFTKGVV